MSTYIIRNIPESLWRLVKSQAALDGTTVRQVILAALRRYVGEPEPTTKEGE